MNHETIQILRPRIPAILAALCLATGALTAVRAQAPAPLPAGEVSAPPAPARPEDLVKLDPFEVQADKNNSYSTLNSNSVTRFNVELEKMPLSADIFDQAFMNDVGATSVEGMIESYSAGAGFSGNDPGATAAASVGDHSSHSNIQLRGFTASYMERDSLMPVGSFFNPGSTGANFTSNFDIERAEVINGPQSMLYSGGGGGGVINVTSKQARLGQPTSGSVLFRMDQYGTKLTQLDFGTGTEDFAMRFAMIGENQDTRRINLSASLEGYYMQVAAKVFGNTTVRISGEQSTYNHILSSSATLAAASTSSDSRNASSLAYLLATNQAGGNTLNAAGQPNSAGALDNGLLNWSNVNSYAGWQNDDLTVNTFVLGEMDTLWTSWLSTQLSAGYNDFQYDLSTPGVSFYAPNSTSNPTPGQWTGGQTPGDLSEPGRAKAVRFVALATNDFFGGKAHSQTIVGGDFLRQDAGQFTYSYLQADSNFNAVISPSITTIGGRTLMPKSYWSINGGPIQYPLFGPRAPRVTLAGVNYVRQLENIVVPSLVTPANPMGTIGTTGTYEIAKAFNQGWFGVNNTQWFDGKLDTMVGIRFAEFFTQSQTAATADSSRRNRSPNFDVGADYALLSWLRAYVSASDTSYVPEEKGDDPIGDPTPTSHAVAEEVGLKVSTQDGRYSGSLAIYHDAGKNEQYAISSAIESDVNPSGLNGRYSAGSSPGTDVYVDRTATGVNIVLTANPTPNWRLRFNAADVGGVIGTATSFNQLYNDQFHENSSGQVTYADGTVVYVPPTFNSKAPTVTASTAGAVPLTVSLMNNSSSLYYAAPLNPSGQISSSQAVYTVLKSVDPVHGSIATGATGLPISAMQITPSFALPGSISVTQQGDHSFGYPELSANLTSIYTFSTGWIKGFEAGGTLAGQWKYSEYYYYPLGVTNSLQRSVYAVPGGGRVDLILAYSRKLGRFAWRSQLNVANMTNHYSIIILPNEATGWSSITALSARYSQDPRSYSWTNTLSF